MGKKEEVKARLFGKSFQTSSPRLSAQELPKYSKGKFSH